MRRRCVETTPRDTDESWTTIHGRFIVYARSGSYVPEYSRSVWGSPPREGGSKRSFPLTSGPVNFWKRGPGRRSPSVSGLRLTDYQRRRLILTYLLTCFLYLVCVFVYSLVHLVVVLQSVVPNRDLRLLFQFPFFPSSRPPAPCSHSGGLFPAPPLYGRPEGDDSPAPVT